MLKSLKSSLCVVLLFSSVGWATCSQVQAPAFTTACTSGSLTCNITVTSTGSNNAIFIGMGAAAAAISISSVSGGGTYSHCAACLISDVTNALSADMDYTLSSTSGTTTITVTRNTSGAAWTVGMWEVSCVGAMSFDVGNTVDDTSSSVSQAGVALTLTGSNDVIVQMERNGNASAISGGYTLQGSGSATKFGTFLNTSSGTAPTWTLSSGAKIVGSAMAIKEAGGTVAKPLNLTILGVGF